MRRNCSTTSALWCSGSSDAVDGVDVDGDATELAELAEVLTGADHAPDVAGRLERVDAGGVTLGRFAIDEREVVAHGRDAGLVGDRAVTGHDGVDVHAEHQVAGGDPVRQRPGPHDRRAADEQDVAGVDRRRVGHVGERVAAGVGGADLDQLDDASTDVELQPTVERAIREPRLDPVELELTEEAAEQVADLALAPR